MMDTISICGHCGIMSVSDMANQDCHGSHSGNHWWVVSPNNHAIELLALERDRYRDLFNQTKQDYYNAVLRAEKAEQGKV
jgi:hypothetical protein